MSILNKDKLFDDSTTYHDRTILHVFLPFVLGSFSTSVSTILYQPLDLLKTRRQLNYVNNPNNSFKSIILDLSKKHGMKCLWRGTGVSLLRAVPGAGLYYSMLDTLQNRFAKSRETPDGQIQAFLFGVTSRTLVSLLFMPVTVTKVHYESGSFEQRNIFKAIKLVCKNSQGWSGTMPTILRDSLFSGTYYFFYSGLKDKYSEYCGARTSVISNFACGIISGALASIITNPFDFIKTQVQANQSKFTYHIYKDLGLRVFFLGLLPRLIRRTLVASTTWSIYEYLNVTN